MTKELLQELRKITTEEERILAGEDKIQKGIYMSSEKNVIDAGKLLDAGKLIQVRPHTRFVHFPEHTHNYIEMIYMCSGSTHHIIDGQTIELREGEVLVLNQQAVQEILPAGEDDIAVNFIILPEFFDFALKLMGEERSLLRDFVVDCLTGTGSTVSYLHFKVGDILPIQNLLENLIWTVRNKQPNKRSINQVTMGLLFLQLLNYLERMETGEEAGERRLILDVLGYIEEHYKEGEFSVLADMLGYDIYWLSREIKKLTGKNYTDLLQEKRLNQAAYLLEHTNMPISGIGQAVGYENMSYFHRIFRARYGVTPRVYRVNK